MRDSLSVAEAAIEKKLEALILRMETAQAEGVVVTEGWLYQEERYEALLTQVRDALDYLARNNAEPLAEAQKGAAIAGADGAEALAKAALGDGPEGIALTWNRLPVESLEALAGFSVSDLPLESLLKELGPAAVEAVHESLVAGLSLGENPREVARRVRGQVGITKARAETIARTEMHRAAREAARLTYHENPDVVTGYVRLSAADAAVCPACWALHGKLYDTSQIMHTHPNCRCVMVPRTKSWAELTGDDSIPDSRPVIEQGEDLFAKLSAEDQKQILGPARFEKYQAGTPLSAFVVTEDDPKFGPTVRVKGLEET